MRSFIIICSILMISLICTGVQAQDDQSKKLTKKEQKALEKQKAMEEKEKIIELMNSKAWVLEANMVYDQDNRNFQLNPSVNFLAVKEDRVVMRLGFNQLPGWDGIDEANVKSDITSYELQEDKSTTAKLRMRFQGRDVGSAFVNITVNADYETRAIISGEFGERLTITGSFVPLDQTKVFNIQTAF